MRTGERLTVGMVALGLGCAAVSAHAQGWQLTPSLTVTETYTDNIDRDFRGKEEEYITRIRPGFDFERRTSRSSAQVGYALESTFYARDTERNDVFHQLDANLTRRLGASSSIAAGMSFGQELLDPANIRAGDFFSNEEVSNTFRAYVAPAWSKQFDDVYSASAQVRRSYIEYSNENLANTVETDASARLDADAGGRVAWGLSARQRQVEPEDREKSVLSEASVDGRLRMSPKVTITGLFGYEDNDIPGTLSEDEATGEFWEVGVIWVPRSRDRVQLTRGERFFGDTTGFSWSHSGPVDLQASHSQTFTTTTQLVFEQTTPDDPPTLVSRGDVVVQTRSQLTAAFGRGKSRYSVTLRAVETENQRTLVTDEEVGAVLTWVVRLNRRDTVDTALSRTEQRFDDDSREQTLERFGLGWARLVGTRATVTARYERIGGADSADLNDFEENRLELGFSATF